MAIVQVESNQLLAHEQYSSWKSKAAITQCLNKWLWYNSLQTSSIRFE